MQGKLGQNSVHGFFPGFWILWVMAFLALLEGETRRGEKTDTLDRRSLVITYRRLIMINIVKF
jgi:hypothetical protein